MHVCGVSPTAGWPLVGLINTFKSKKSALADLLGGSAQSSLIQIHDCLPFLPWTREQRTKEDQSLLTYKWLLRNLRLCWVLE